MKWLKAIWDYFRKSWEGKDGKFSYRRAFQYAFGISAIVIGNQSGLTETQFKVVFLFSMLFILMAGLMTVQQLIELLKYEKLSQQAGINPYSFLGDNNNTGEGAKPYEEEKKDS
jgi:hypothetical protein